MKEKTCHKCKQSKNLDDFTNRHTRYKDGKDTWCKECKINATRIMKYGITNEQYNALLIKQDYKCAICDEKESDLKTKGNKNFYPLCVDHSHDNKMIRGLLCNNCNRAIGLLKDNSKTLYRAYKYLKQNENG